ncbi:fatty acyl-CoA reductase 1 [Halyomorpha halys]|uniref:fatty acyl-CoA reductase 1 n=1 Tax=Halyomorpha halys TaxID=286706 RepID=UPI0006D4E141|nr:fatty acyl-CoA reductase 1-like [Halyomorpha halys]XP_014283473.1 fatty acyl-CoA reductase 1-like [Halyomorpha halys]
MTTIKEWTNNKTILITGGAGFFGKVLTEKLLRACPGVKRIYLIIRPKGGQTPQERWANIVKDELFEKLLAEAPDIMDRKVTVLDGDMSLINLGLTQENIEELKNTVDIIFHSAATVRFNDPLHKAFLSNTRGTLELCKLASEMNNLEVFVHVSTTYCNHNLKKHFYEEKVYEPCQDWRIMLKLIEEENPTVMNTISYKITQDHPNTYTFTKSLSEKIVEEYSSKFPVVISRPSVVVGIAREPLLGWTDNVNGVTGVTTAVCKGVMRVIKGRKNCKLDYVAVDIAINALIISGWEKSISENKELSIYNCAYADFMPVSFETLTTQGLDINERECTFDNDIWYPFLLFAMNNLYFHILFYLLQVIPAVLIDSVLFLMKKKPRLIKITIKIYQAIQALEAFTMEDVVFDNKEYKALWEKLTDEDARIFSVKPPVDLKMEEVMLILHKGMKKYFLKENLEDNEHHRLKLRRFYYLDRFVRGILISTLVISVFKLINALLYRYVL